jgi:mono/diheme cytochrome c family protein
LSPRWEYQDKLLAITAVFALLTLASIVYAVWREEHPVWERYEREYREAVAAAIADMPEERREATLAGLRRGAIQDWVPGARVVDRCRTCHRGMDEPLMAGAPAPHQAHPGDVLLHHPPSEYGCSVCHGGQGLSLASVTAAHGWVEYWDEPMLPTAYLEMSCGRCHRNAEVPTPEVVERGRAVAERECASCHERGEGDASARSLGRVGIQRSRSWLAGYLLDATSVHARYGNAAQLPREDVEALVAELATRKGAEKLLQGELLYNRRGCGGCHKIGGVGGVLGVDLSEEGLRLPRQLDFSRMSGPGDVVAWQKAHLLKPSAVVPETNMIDPKFRSDEIELMVTYILSLVPAWDYDAWRPPDQDGFREAVYTSSAARGRTLYGRYCAACHGLTGKGRIDVVHGGYAPALFNPTFLALADRDFIAYNIRIGREERNMPAWRTTAGLSDADILSIALFLESLPKADQPAYAGPFRGSSEGGRAAYEVQCAGCHGERGEGGVGPALALPGVQKASDEYLYRTIAVGRPGTAMLPYDLPGGTGLPRERIADVVAYLRTLPEQTDE